MKFTFFNFDLRLQAFHMVEYDEDVYLPQYVSLFWVTFLLNCEFLGKVHETRCDPLVQDFILESVATNFTFT